MGKNESVLACRRIGGVGGIEVGQRYDIPSYSVFQLLASSFWLLVPGSCLFTSPTSGRRLR
jgi:hypothetical protein